MMLSMTKSIKFTFSQLFYNNVIVSLASLQGRQHKKENELSATELTISESICSL